MLPRSAGWGAGRRVRARSCRICELRVASVSGAHSTSWNTAQATDSQHELTAVARDAAGNTTTSSKITVTVGNAAPGPNGLVAAYSFNEGSGTIAADTSTKRNAGSVSGAAWTTGKNGGGLSFDGVDDWVTVPDADSLDLLNGMTLEAWIKPTQLTSWRQVILKEQLSGLSYALYSNTDTNRPNTEVGSSGTLYGPSALTADAWTHLASTYDGTTIRLYVNGVQVASRAASVLMPASTGP